MTEIYVGDRAIDLPTLDVELGALAPTGAQIRDGYLYQNGPAWPPAELPPEAVPIVDAHVAPPNPYDYVETKSVHARLTTTDGAFHEVYRFPTTANCLYRATFSMSAIDGGSFDCKDSQARLVFKRSAAALTQVGTTIALGTAQDTAANAWAIQAQAQGTDLLIGVRGAAGRTIDWILSGEVAVFAPSGV